MRARTLSFKTDSENNFVQIVNTERKKDGHHWVVITNAKFVRDIPESTMRSISVYDSMYDRVNTDTRQSICSLMKKSLPINVKHVSIQVIACPIQEGVDCGLHAIANATMICHDLPTNCIDYGSTVEMRQHLITCLENRVMTPFPTRQISPGPMIQSIVNMEVHCTCRMPDCKN